MYDNHSILCCVTYIFLLVHQNANAFDLKDFVMCNEMNIFVVAVYNIWVRVYTVILCVGEGYRDARVQEYVQESSSTIACGDPHLVFGHCVPFFRTD